MLIGCDVQAKALLEVKPQMDAAGVNLMALSVGGSSIAHQCGALILSVIIRMLIPFTALLSCPMCCCTTCTIRFILIGSRPLSKRRW